MTTRYCYLGKSDQGSPNFELDALTRHCVILGATGSGKTGVGVNILESCLLNKIPIIAIDPKGDIGNLLYMPTEFSSREFASFNNVTESLFIQEDIAKLTKQAWEDWQIPPYLGVNILGTTDIRLYTPGMDFGLPLGLFGSSKPPQSEDSRLSEASELAQSLAKLLGLKSGPFEDETVLLEQLIWVVWKKGKNVALATLLDSFPMVSCQDEKTVERFQTRLQVLNQSITFRKWSKKPTLDIEKLLWNGGKTPCCSILNTATLTNEDQQFFLSILLSKLLSWVKTQPSSNELKAVLYIDECQGLIPAIGNPLTKTILMTLIKQARAFGLGVVLATQNPGDIDYKALSNIGTWITGLLKTDRDRKKVSQAIGVNKYDTELQKREFIYHDSFSGKENIKFKSRQTMCYLKGPMDQKEIERVTAWRKLENIDTEKFSETYHKLHYNPSENEIVKQRMITNLGWQLKDMIERNLVKV